MAADTKEKILLGMLDLIYEVGLEKASMGKLSKKMIFMAYCIRITYNPIFPSHSAGER